MPSPVRQKRVSDRIQAELADLLRDELNDPRLALVTVTQVNIDRELEYANIFVATLGDATRREEVLLALARAKGFIRRALAQRLQLRRAPELIFHWDVAPDKGEAMMQLIEQLEQAETHPAAPPPPVADDDDPDHQP
jgi:ribosome-binding factor A